MTTEQNPHISLTAQELTAADFSRFGEVLSAESGGESTVANHGLASLYQHLARIENRRPDTATQNWKLFRSRPNPDRPVRVTQLEKHDFSTQLFVPMGGAGRYLVVVAEGGDAPDPNTLQAFVARENQAITYHPGVWHAGMTVLDRESDMLCLIYEDGSESDCLMVPLAPIEVRVEIGEG